MSASKGQEQIVQRMQVPDRPNLYVVGCFERRITLYTQQVRALNLVWAITGRRLPRQATIAVIGAGAAGVTAAAAAALLDYRVTIFERLPRPLDLIGPCRHRWLHPHIYDWPADGSDAPDAGLPLLNWTQDLAFRVIDQMRAEWDRLVRTLNIESRCGVTEVGVHGLEGGQYLVTWNGGHQPTPNVSTWGNRSGRRMQSRAFDVVMLTAGFGIETKTEAFPVVRSYWTADNFDEEDRHRLRPDRKVLISGTGDGGLIDALRLSFSDFRHEAILRDLREKWLDQAAFLRVCAEVNTIEKEAHAIAKAGRPYREFLAHRYHELANGLIVRGKVPVRENVSVTLTGRHPLPFDLLSSPLNRFLVSLTNTEYIPGPVQCIRNADPEGYVVTFPGDRVEHFNDVVVRHGPTPALKLSFPEVWEQCKSLREAADSIPDPSRVPTYGDLYGGLLSRHWASSPAGDVPLPPSSEEIERAVVKSRPADEPGGDVWAMYRAWILASFEKPSADGFCASAASFVLPYVEAMDKPHDHRHRAGNTLGASPRSADGLGDEGHGGVVLRADALAADGTQALVTGAPGSGKTTLLRYLAYLQVRDDRAFALFVPCHHLHSCRSALDLPMLLFDTAITSAGRGRFSAHDREVLRRHFAAALVRGQVAIYIDGLDEMLADEREALLALTAAFLSSAPPGNSLLLSTRAGAHTWSSAGLAIYRILPFNRRQAEELLQRFAPDANAADHLKRSRLSHPGLLESPLLLSQYCAAACHGGVSGVGFDVYLRMLSTLSPDQHVVTAVRRALSHAALRSLAAVTQEGGRPPAVITEADLKAAAPEEGGADMIASALSAASRLVVEGERGEYRFSHRMFEEFFAAQGLVDSPDPFSALESFALRPGFDGGSFLPMAVAFIPDVNQAYKRLEALPDGIDFPVLRLRAQALRYARGVDASHVERLGQDVAVLVAARDQGGIATARHVAADLAGVDDSYTESIVRQLTPPLRDPDLQVRIRAVLALGALKSEKTVEHVVTALRDPEREVREAAAAALGEIQGPVAVAELHRAYLHDDGPMVFSAALQSLITVGDTLATAAIVSIVNDRALSVNLRWPAIRALGKIGDHTAFDVIIAAVDERASTIREAAAEALGNIRDPAAIPALRRRLGDAEVLVRYYGGKKDHHTVTSRQHTGRRGVGSNA